LFYCITETVQVIEDQSTFLEGYTLASPALRYGSANIQIEAHLI